MWTLTAIDRWRPYSPRQAAVNHLDVCGFGGCTDAMLVAVWRRPLRYGAASQAG
jgi:hypothetical protein